MRCLSCQYDLNNLAVHRCPECGRAFDPTNPQTFEVGTYLSWWRIMMKLGIGVFVACLGLVLAVNIVAILGQLIRYLFS